MKRCFDLSRLGMGKVSPNPSVGAVIVENDRILGEGWHKVYGQSHAEVNAVSNIKSEDLGLLEKSSIYVSLEPCSITGNTPPCTSLIIKNKIPIVNFGSQDRTKGVYGKSSVILEKNNIEVRPNCLSETGNYISRFRNIFVTKFRPYIILKYAKSKDGYLGLPNKAVWLTNYYSKVLVHKWRSEVDAIMVGTNTAVLDNPKLTNRLYFGKSPTRILLDLNLRVAKTHHILDAEADTWIFNKTRNETAGTNKYIQTPAEQNALIPFMLEQLYESNKAILMVEGGGRLLQSFIDLNLWDEARIFETSVQLNEGIKAPELSASEAEIHDLDGDKLKILFNT